MLRAHTPRFALAFTALCATALAHAAPSLKPGLWEMKITRQIVDGKDMVAQMQQHSAEMQRALAQMPPEQRKQMEKMLGVQMTQDATVNRICVSPAMASLDKNLVQAPKTMNCPPPTITHSGNQVKFAIDCKDGARTAKGSGISVVNGDFMQSQVNMTTTDPQTGKHSMDMASEMRFVQSDCGAVRPLDQVAKDLSRAEAKTPAKK